MHVATLDAFDSISPSPKTFITKEYPVKMLSPDISFVIVCPLASADQDVPKDMLPA